jgi:hypothetical protein
MHKGKMCAALSLGAILMAGSGAWTDRAAASTLRPDDYCYTCSAQIYADLTPISIAPDPYAPVVANGVQYETFQIYCYAVYTGPEGSIIFDDGWDNQQAIGGYVSTQNLINYTGPAVPACP